MFLSSDRLLAKAIKVRSLVGVWTKMVQGITDLAKRLEPVNGLSGVA